MKKALTIITLLLGLYLNVYAQKTEKKDPTWIRGFATIIDGSLNMYDGLGYSVGTVMGYRINQYLFVGGGFKYFQWTMNDSKCEQEKDWGRKWGREEWGSTYKSIPFYQSFKVYTSNKDFAPYYRLDIGVDIFQYDYYLSSQFGFDIKLGKKKKTALIYGIGLQLLDGEKTPNTIGDHFVTGFMNLGFQL